MKRVLAFFAFFAFFALLAPFALFAQAPRTAAPSPRRTLRVLFVGNSYTFVNNLGDVLAGIAASLKGPAIEPFLTANGMRR